MSLQSLHYSRGSLRILNQLLLPHVHTYEDASTCEGAHHAIQSMKVRGAPLIAITAALGLAAELEHLSLNDSSLSSYGGIEASTSDNLRNWIHNKLDYLVTSRPTAVNLFQVSHHLKNILNHIESTASLEDIKKIIIQACEQYYEEDLKTNQAIGSYGAKIFASQKNVNILTHCNTGSLATSGYGTALGVIRSLASNQQLNHVYCTETRPYNQGARLTAYELVYEKIPATLVADSMASFLMHTKKIHAVIVGADRIAANGDTANKIGTYQLAISAFYHNVPFFVAAPRTTFDCKTISGENIKIEERPMHELTHIGNMQIAASHIDAWNPSFDVTPAHLITGFITEHGVLLKDNTNQYHFTEDNVKPCTLN